MKTRLFALLLLASFGSASVAVPLPAWAQGASDEATKNLARARFTEGVTYFDKGQFEQARAAFLQAYTLRKHPAILVNLAWSCLRSSHFLEAHRYFEQFLAEGKDITAAQHADVSDGLSQADVRLGLLEITTANGLDVSVDGDHVGTAPLSGPVAVDVGAHTIKVLAPDGAASTQSVTAAAGERKAVRVVLAAPAPAPARAPAPAPAAVPPAEPPAPAGESQPAPVPAPIPESGGSGVWPVNMVPMVVGVGLVVVSAAVAVGAAVATQSAKTNANNQANKVRSANESCPAPSMAPSSLVTACANFSNDNSQWNQDATLGNVAVGVGIAAAVGTVVYWVAAKKQHGAASDATTATEVKLVPVVGTSFGGLSVSTAF